MIGLQLDSGFHMMEAPIKVDYESKLKSGLHYFK